MSILEIFLSKNDFERIANGHDLKIRISSGKGFENKWNYFEA